MFQIIAITLCIPIISLAFILIQIKGNVHGVSKSSFGRPRLQCTDYHLQDLLGEAPPEVIPITLHDDADIEEPALRIKAATTTVIANAFCRSASW